MFGSVRRETMKESLFLKEDNKLDINFLSSEYVKDTDTLQSFQAEL